ncbi:MAG: Si-specific NAD(P)(+) transhydrogenase [Myxococcota bacterium]
MVYDVLVLGAGPAGWAAALQAAKLGLHVGVIEKDSRFGGACVHTGTLPSKTLRHTILELVAAHRVARVGLHTRSLRPLTIQDLMGPSEAVVEAHERTIRAFFERNGVEVLAGSASFVRPDRVRVASADAEREIEARNVIIATGSRPRRPEAIPFDDRAVCDSDSLLGLDAIPRRFLVLGGGVIGCEYACMFAALGSRVTLIDRRRELLRFVDQDLVDTLKQSMRRSGIRLMLGEELAEICIESGGRGPAACLTLSGGRRARGDRLLVAAGRESCTAALDLERIGIACAPSGEIKVDEHHRTEVPGVYAVGDVIGFPALASTSMHQGRLAVLHAAGWPLPPASPLPLALYTIPEISSVGRSEEECRAEGIGYEVGYARYAETPRGQILGDEDGLLKLVFRREDRRILGVHLIGQNSSELVHTGLTLLQLGGTLEDILAAVYNYPTLSEAYRIAALDGVNRL